MKQKWKPIQYIEISMHEIFCLQDKLDAVKDNPEEVWEVFDDFLMECENQLELDPGFIKELSKISKEDFTPLKDKKTLFDNDFDNPHEKTAQDYINYVISYTNKKRYEIPFTPRHDF